MCSVKPPQENYTHACTPRKREAHVTFHTFDKAPATANRTSHKGQVRGQISQACSPNTLQETSIVCISNGIIKYPIKKYIFEVTLP